MDTMPDTIAPKAKPQTVEYMVSAGSITLRVGKKPDQVRVIRHGARIKLFPEATQTKAYLHSKSIVPMDSPHVGKRVSARAVMTSFANDPGDVLQPLSDMQPLTATPQQAEDARS